MFDQLFKRPYYVNRHINAPFLKERLDYIQLHADRGCATQSLRDVAQYLLRIIEFLNLKSSSVVSLEEIEVAANQWAKYQSRHPMKRRPFSIDAKERFIYHAIKWLKMIHRLALPEVILKIFERGAAIKRHANAPLLKERLLYLRYWAENGAVENSLRRIDQYLLIVMEYLNFYELRSVTQNEINEAANRWAKNKITLRRKNDCSKSAKARFISDASGWFNLLGCLKLPDKITLPFENELSKYILYMRHEQGLAETTIKSRLHLLQDFLNEVAITCKSLLDLTPLVVDAVIIKKHEINGYSRRTVQSYATIIRGFLRHQGNNGNCSPILADTIKSPRVYKYETLPSSPSWDDVKVILKSTEGDNPTCIRDRAIIMLLSIYGLRCSEVAKLCLDDIDWKSELLHLKRAKTAKPQTFPLTLSVGNVLLRYIKEVRPNRCSLREIFLCMRSPYRPMTNSCIYQIVNRKMKPLGLAIKHHGPHALRHACATHLINEGVSLKEIADQLGHQGLETTRIYTKVDLNSLRQIAEFDIGDLL